MAKAAASRIKCSAFLKAIMLDLGGKARCAPVDKLPQVEMSGAKHPATDEKSRY